MTIEQWGFFSLQHLLWHWAFIYDGQLRGPVILTPIAERLAVELQLTVFTAWVGRGWIQTPILPLAGRTNVLTHRTTAATRKCESGPNSEVFQICTCNTILSLLGIFSCAICSHIFEAKEENTEKKSILKK